MAHSPHRQHKGCSICKPHKLRTHGQSERQPRSSLRKIGKTRRITRHDLGDWNEILDRTTRM
jgi:hypothetical protein